MNKPEIRKPLSFRNATQLLNTTEDDNKTVLDNVLEESGRTPLSTTKGTDQPTFNSSSSSDQISDEVLLAEQVRREKERNEPYQMFFYYPKYLHPEAVALIAQNLLNEWEEEENKLSTSKSNQPIHFENVTSTTGTSSVLKSTSKQQNSDLLLSSKKGQGEQIPTSSPQQEELESNHEEEVQDE
ncbi:hypothetical protein C9374_006679 [Naegleria lovaniensis]|uniref:Uncharacterized protein n=1 Tax=Naegleria lovaniensis TaxID=51637 RepID=A0AA88GLF1_NAELO|nr:uncharacterized protein C9374_006679 [Naegleria lovaniensis]KAG2379562.1 hypothetical protein C9374_006679 [Naegleria lovaniensis]